MTIDIVFSEGQMFTPIFEESVMQFTPDFGEIVIIGTTDTYTGDYIATPLVTEQIFETKNKVMTDDFTVNGIPKSDVINIANGYTATIGGL